jgi:Protein of unknown function (DUF2612).
VTLQDYLGLITSEHRDKPKFAAMLSVVLQPFADNAALCDAMQTLFDLDTATGAQLDAIGEWIGVSRTLAVPLTGVYFSFNTSGQGFNQGTWFTSGAPINQLTELPDQQYRLLLLARTLNNRWDGSFTGAVAILQALFAGTGHTGYIVDYGDLTMQLGFSGSPFDAITEAIFQSGALDVRPAGVLITARTNPTNPPIFALDPAPNQSQYAGLDIGVWAT